MKKLLLTLLLVTWSLLLKAESVSLAWEASTSSDVVGYYVWVGNESLVYTNRFFVSGTSATVTVDRTLHFYNVTAVTGEGLESNFSDEAHWPQANHVELSWAGGEARDILTGYLFNPLSTWLVVTNSASPVLLKIDRTLTSSSLATRGGTGSRINIKKAHVWE